MGTQNGLRKNRRPKTIIEIYKLGFMNVLSHLLSYIFCPRLIKRQMSLLSGHCCPFEGGTTEKSPKAMGCSWGIPAPAGMTLSGWRPAGGYRLRLPPDSIEMTALFYNKLLHSYYFSMSSSSK